MRKRAADHLAWLARRGLRNLCGNSAPLRGASRAHDVFAAVAALRALPWVDGGRGAVVEYNPKAHEDSEKQVRQFLEAQLKP